MPTNHTILAEKIVGLRQHASAIQFGGLRARRMR